MRIYNQYIKRSYSFSKEDIFSALGVRECYMSMTKRALESYQSNEFSSYSQTMWKGIGN